MALIPICHTPSPKIGNADETNRYQESRLQQTSKQILIFLLNTKSKFYHMLNLSEYYKMKVKLKSSHAIHVVAQNSTNHGISQSCNLNYLKSVKTFKQSTQRLVSNSQIK